MKTAVDTSVLLDVLAADARFGERSRVALRNAYDAGAVVACDVVWAEVRANYEDDDAFESAVGELGIRYESVTASAARHAGMLWRLYHRERRGPRERLIADFLIGAHAEAAAERLLTRDRGFYRRYFSSLKVIDPTVLNPGRPTP